jgi:hypothetical protein
MKTIKLISALTLGIIISSCSKTDTKTASASTYSFEYTIDGTPYSWSGGAPTSTSTARCVAVITGGDCSLAGVRDNLNGPNRFPQLISNFPAKVGSYVMDLNSATPPNNKALTVLLSQTKQVSSMGGKITFNVTDCPTGLNSHVKGNFSGNLAELVGSTFVMHPISGKFDACNLTP